MSDMRCLANLYIQFKEQIPTSGPHQYNIDGNLAW